MDRSEVEKISKALADQTRLRIFEAISATDHMNCGEIVSMRGVTPATVSHHLKILSEAGLIACRREGQFVYSESVPETIAAYTRALAKIARGRKHRAGVESRERAVRFRGNLLKLIRSARRNEMFVTAEQKVLQSVAMQLMNGEEVALDEGDQKLRVKRVGSGRLRMVQFKLNGRMFEAIEQNREKPSRWGKLAREKHQVVQFRDLATHKYVAVAVDGEIKEYGR
jgi:ArsR family transcriptional regulator